jgi:hypothetical protein
MNFSDCANDAGSRIGWDKKRTVPYFFFVVLLPLQEKTWPRPHALSPGVWDGRRMEE